MDAKQAGKKIKPAHSWKDFNFSKSRTKELKEIASKIFHERKLIAGTKNRVRRQSSHILLFTGPGGSGKTLAAEVIANELNKDIYRIDLSRVVSKYIGETEKNLDKIFKSAERGDYILFFDEADALFGKRSEVKDSHDRYANIETGYLLQRIESYKSLVIVSSDMKAALDDAFIRRLHFIVHFPPKEKRASSLNKKSKDKTEKAQEEILSVYKKRFESLKKAKKKAIGKYDAIIRKYDRLINT